MTYLLLTLAIGIYLELELGDARENSAARIGRMVGYAFLWPLMLVGLGWAWWCLRGFEL